MSVADSSVLDVQPNFSSWRRNLVIVWLSQFFSLSAFGFGLPFISYYIQTLGVRDWDEVLYWTSIFVAAAPLAFAVAAPIWGALADRFGRKAMLLRANLGAVIVLFGMGLAPLVPWPIAWLIGCRVLQGVLTGTVPAAQTLVTASTPHHRRGLALGALSAGLFSGIMAGQFFGGLSAEAFGYAASFRIAGGLALVAALLALLAHEDTKVVRLAAKKAAAESDGRWRIPQLGAAWPVLWLWFAATIPVLMDQPVLPLLVQDLQGGAIEGAALLMSGIGVVSALAAMLAGIVLGWLSDRFPPWRLAQAAAIGAAVFLIPISLAPSYAFLLVLRFPFMLCLGGINPLFQIMVGRTAPEGKIGTAFGWATACRSLAWVIGPILGAQIAGEFGLSVAFQVEALMCLALVEVIGRVARRHAAIGKSEPQRKLRASKPKAQAAPA